MQIFITEIDFSVMSEILAESKLKLKPHVIKMTEQWCVCTYTRNGKRRCV